jgi:heptose-I-phosphate ethanolaminephosphotransferase
MAGVPRDLWDQFSNELPVAAYVVLLIAPIVACFVARPSIVLLLFVLCTGLVIILLARRLYTSGETAYLGFYLILLYPLLIPGLIGEATIRYYLFYYCLTILLFSPLFIVRRGYLLAKLSCMLSVALVFSINFVFMAYAIQARAPMDSAALLAIYQTDVAEAVGYVEAFIEPIVAIGLLLVLVALLLLVARIRPPTIQAFSRRWQLALMAVALALAWETRASSNEFQLYSTIWGYRDMLQDYREVSARRQTDYRQIDARLIREDPETHVIVIGESSTRNHMDIYGYFRPTTTKLNSIKEELIIFTDVISSHSHTMDVLEKALTLASLDNDLDYSHAEAYSVMELFKAAGVTTYWLSNQNRFGIWDNVVTIIAEGADHVTFVSDRVGDDYGASPDEELLVPFREALEDDVETKVIFLHLMGTHAPYHRRYPPDFAQFSGPLPAAGFGVWPGRGWISEWFRGRSVAKRVNDYDNAIAYTDHLILDIIEILNEYEPASSLLYFSDHGEAPLEGTGHDSARFSRSHVEIPFLFWFSEAFEEAHSDLIESLSSNRQKKVMTDSLEHTILDLVGVDTRYLEYEKSAFRSNLAEQDRLTLSGTINYDQYDEPLLNAKRNMEALSAIQPSLHPKIWAHRANSLGKLSEVMGVFPGAEIDVVYDEVADRLQVRHPPVADIGLDLEEVLRFLETNEAETRLWLDFKNLEEGNLDKVLRRLSDLDQRYALKRRVIVETTYTGKGFDRYAELGFYTSYYLPTEDILSAMDEGESARLELLAGEVADVVRRHRPRAISFDIRLYDFVRERLEGVAAAHGLEYLTWDLSLDSSKKGFAEEMSQREFDERIKVVLVPFTSRFRI